MRNVEICLCCAAGLGSCFRPEVYSSENDRTTYRCVGNSSTHGAHWTLDGHLIDSRDLDEVTEATIEDGSGNVIECCLHFSERVGDFTCRSLLINTTGMIIA